MITAIAGLLTTRFALQALGADNYGLFSVVGGVISFIAIINTVLLSTSNRFIATAIGKGDEKLINITFNVNLVVHIMASLLTIAVAYPLGDWYILNYINYDGDINNVLYVYHVTIIGSVISFIGVPYNGLLLAKERFLVFSSTDILSSIIKVIISYLLISHFEDKLIVYAFTICITTAFPTVVFIIYCKKKFSKIIAFKFVKTWKEYKEVFSFSIWVGYGAIATISKSQGAALIVNNFFNTLMNTALGIANSVNSIILMFANNVGRSMSPQIVKSYASGNIQRSETLVVMASKFSFMVMLFVSSPFLIAPEWLFSLWLGEVPESVTIFTLLIIIDALIGTFNAGIPDLIFATGKIKWYQLIVNTLFILSVVVAYFILRTGKPAYYLQVTYIVFSFIVLIIRQIVLNKVVRFNNWTLIKKSYIPCLIISTMYLPIFFLKEEMRLMLLIMISYLYLMILYYLIGLSKSEKSFIKNKVTIVRKIE